MIITNDTNRILSLSEDSSAPSYIVVLEPGETRDVSFHSLRIAEGDTWAIALPPPAAVLPLRPNQFEDAENG